MMVLMVMVVLTLVIMLMPWLLCDAKTSFASGEMEEDKPKFDLLVPFN